MNKLEKVFTDFINEGGAAAKRITEPDKKAMAYAALAQAIAHSGLMIDRVTTTMVGSPEPEPETVQEKTGKDSLKADAGKGKSKKTKTQETVQEEVPAPVEVAEETQEEAPVEAPVEVVEEVTEEVLDAEWTDEMQEKKAEQLAILNSYIEAWSEDFVCRECLGAFCEDASITADQLWDYIRPTNIDGFLIYLESLSQE